MFEIPSDLPLRLASLAWLLGRWQGWGTIAAPNTAPAPEGEEESVEETSYLPVLQDIHATVVGEQMKMTIRTYEGVLEGDFDPTWTADEGLDRIEPGTLISEESAYWSVDTPLAVVPAGPDEPREVRVSSASIRAFSILWAGVAVGPRIQLASDGVVRAPRADKLDYFSRMFGLVGGELMWASESMVRGGEYEVEITGRLRRATDEAAVNKEVEQDTDE